jgi:hypothetical protein
MRVAVVSLMMCSTRIPRTINGVRNKFDGISTGLGPKKTGQEFICA